jgi:signal transduction histidine kinase
MGEFRSGGANLDQRAVSLGGSFRVEPAAGGGTELVWRVPLAGAARAAADR